MMKIVKETREQEELRKAQETIARLEKENAGLKKTIASTPPADHIDPWVIKQRDNADRH